tara:strand:- start:838 stop:3132 length:2295 start_codon:yes stop_codon:yes gene_type:complete
MALNKQMELFEDGGLMDEGGTVDKVSGNDVPTGSTQEEVRDDIPANLSEGEFVLPADVVRYHGLEKIMELRDEAKAGLQKMDDMGQMGNSEEATLPDDMPFSIDDLDMEDDGIPDFQVGGYVAPTFNQGQLQQSQFANYTPQYTPYQAPDYTNQATGYQPPQQAATPMAPSAIPSFSSFVTPTYVAYVNEAGNTIQIPVDASGKPLIPVPAGFTKQSEQPDTPTVPTTDQPQQGIQQMGSPMDDGVGSDGPAPTPLTGEALAINNLTKTSAFKDINNLLDTRTGMEKFGDTVESVFANTLIGKVLGAGSTTSQEYATAKKDLAKDIINYSSDPVEQEKIMGEVKTQLEFAEANPKTAAEIAATPVIQGFERYPDGTAKRDAAGNRIGPNVQTVRDVKETAITDITDTSSQDNQAAQDLAAGTRVRTTQVTQGDTTVSEDVAAKAADMEQRMSDLGLTANQRKDFLNAVLSNKSQVVNFASSKDMMGALGKTGTDVSFKQGDPPEAALSNLAAKTLLDKMDKSISSESYTPAKPTAAKNLKEKGRVSQAMANIPRMSDDERRDEELAERGLSNQYDAKTTRENRQRDSSYNPSEDKESVYTSNSGRSFNVSGFATDDTPSQGTTFSSGYLSTDSSGKVTGAAIPGSQEYEDRGGDPGPSKIVCTEMYRQTQLDDWAKAIKIWDVYQRRYLTPLHEVGYHWLFKPYVRGMKNNSTLTSLGAYLAKERTQHLRHILTKGRAKDSLVGNVWCKIIHPIVYLAGKIKNG